MGPAANAHQLDGYQPVRRRERQRPEHDRVHDAEHGAVRPDANRKREDGGHGERRGAAKLPHGITDVAKDIVEQPPAPDVTAFLPDQRHVAERPARGGSRGLARQAGGHQLVDLFLEMQIYLIGHVAGHAAAGQQLPDPAQGVHGFTGASTSLMPSSIRSKLETSRSRCCLPARVSW